MCFVKGLRLRKTEKWARKSDGRGAIWESGIIWSYEKLKLARRCGCTPLWREAHFQIKTYKKICSEHFWKLRCWSWKNARGCGAKHISKSKCAIHTLLPEHFWKFTRHCGAKQMSKSTCQKTPQVRNAFGDWDVEKVRTIVARSTLPSPNVKTPHAWSIFGSWDVENGKQISKSKCEQNQMFGPLKKGCDAGKVHAVVKGSKIRSENDKSTTCSDHFWRLRGQQSARCCGSTFGRWDFHSTLPYTTLHHTTLPLQQQLQ